MKDLIQGRNNEAKAEVEPSTLRSRLSLKRRSEPFVHATKRKLLYRVIALADAGRSVVELMK